MVGVLRQGFLTDDIILFKFRVPLFWDSLNLILPIGEKLDEKSFRSF